MTDLTTDSGLLGNCLRLFVLGVIQGLTEFLPISSTAHIKALPFLLGWEDPGVSTTAVLQLGSILAVIIYFKQDLKKILKGMYRAYKIGQWHEPNARLGIAICIGTIPILLAGLFIKLRWSQFETSSLSSS